MPRIPPDPISQARRCHDITAARSKNKSFPGLAIVGLRFDGRYPGGCKDLYLRPQVHRFDPPQQPVRPVSVTVSLSKTLNFMLCRGHHSFKCIYSSAATLYSCSAALQGEEILHFLIHSIYLTASVTSYFIFIFCIEHMKWLADS